MMLQLNPTIPVYVVEHEGCKGGTGYAVLVIDYSQEHNLYWTIFLDDSGECWTVSNQFVRAQKNISLGRIPTKIISNTSELKECISDQEDYIDELLDKIYNLELQLKEKELHEKPNC